LFNDLHSNFLNADMNIEKRRFVKKLLRNITAKGYRLIILIDEFDNAKDIFKLQDFQFLREISYNLETKIGIVTISRKTIQELEPDNGSLSNFYQIFDELRLKLFTNDDLSLYWERLKNLGLKVSDNYIDNLIFYSGKHPFLLDLINYSIFNKIEQTEINLDEVFNSTLEDLKLKLFNEYESILKLMNQENLDNKLIQMIIGPVYDITQRDVEKLLKYSLVKSKPDESFECFAKFFEEYLSIKSNEVDVWPLFSNFENKMRNIIRQGLIELYGEDWVKKYSKKTVIQELELARNENKKAFGDRASEDLINYTYPRHFYDGFITANWDWYKKILKKDKGDWKPVFSHLAKIRNPLAHNNPNFLSEADKNIATGYCQEILNLIIKWKESANPFNSP